MGATWHGLVWEMGRGRHSLPPTPRLMKQWRPAGSDDLGHGAAYGSSSCPNDGLHGVCAGVELETAVSVSPLSSPLDTPTISQEGQKKARTSKLNPPPPSALHQLTAAYADLKRPVHCASFFMIPPCAPVQLRSGRDAISFWPNHRLQIQSRGNSKNSPVLHHNHDITLIHNLSATSSAASASTSASRGRTGTGAAPG